MLTVNRTTPILLILNKFESPISPLVYYSEIFLGLQDTDHIPTFKLLKNGALGSK